MLPFNLISLGKAIKIDHTDTCPVLEHHPLLSLSLAYPWSLLWSLFHLLDIFFSISVTTSAPLYVVGRQP